MIKKLILFLFIVLFFNLFLQCKMQKGFTPPKDMVLIQQEKKSFFVDKTEVSVKDFSNFVCSKNYITEAEKFGNSIVFKNGNWQLVEKANWRYPFGMGEGSYVAKGNHPVVHVSYRDAVAYAKFVNKRLPTEKEWELISQYAAKKLATQGKNYPWGNNITKKNKPIINIWQGEFPSFNNQKDGFLYTSPVGFFSQSDLLGISDIGGNVWEICNSNQWFWFSKERQKWYQKILSKKKLIKGGSFMCHESYCHGYQFKNKMAVYPNESYFHVGFRLVKDNKNR